MSVKIHSISLGMCRCYVIQDKGTIVIDAGSTKQINHFKKAIKELSINPKDIQLIIITHKHYDHISLAKDIKDFTDAEIAMHYQDKDGLEKSQPQSPPPGVTVWGRILSKVLSGFMSKTTISTTNVDVVIGDEGLSLDKYGISGRIIHTPGHTHGSVSVLLETGDAFVGDLMMNGLPMRFGAGLPIFAEDLQKVKESCKLLLGQDAKTIYPGHGKPFSADAIHRYI
jgi:hydroxyacylglutathione hydrolase